MSKDDDWIDARVGEARKVHPLVTDGVETRMKGMLKGQFSERQIPPMEMAQSAQTLLADMATSDLTKGEISHED